MAAQYRRYDSLVVGAGIFGLHAAALLRNRGERVAIIDIDHGPMLRASLVNQARLHNGYHYPRSIYTAVASARHYARFCSDFAPAVNGAFTKVYAISSDASSTDADQFIRFCETVAIPLSPLHPDVHFQPGSVAAAFSTDEVCFDAHVLRELLVARLHATPGVPVDFFRSCSIRQVDRDGQDWKIELGSDEGINCSRVVNASYAGTNAVLRKFGLPGLPLKYELCEVVLVEAPRQSELGFTVMDGPFFSLLPFGHTGLHSLTAVEYTPRIASTTELPTFACQAVVPGCSPSHLENCSACPAAPTTVYPFMAALAKRFLADCPTTRRGSLWTVKATLRTAEVDDARPTLVQRHCSDPTFTTVFAGKVSSIYDLDGML